MKIRRFMLFSLFLVLFSGFVYGGGFLIEAKGLYFQPSDQNFKDIYSNGSFKNWVSYGGEIGVTIWKGLGIWAGGHYFLGKGELTYTQEETKIWLIPVYGGLKFRVLKGNVSPYIGVGVGYFLYKERNRIGKVERGDIGYIGQAGLLFKILKLFIIDIQASYTYCSVRPRDLKADLGGIQAGIGFGIEF
ncbi:MAG: hypothetical protein PVI11_06055 [Candidatus Aminicenantes bacterium]|jgi:opacity protein-like surface antigen